MTTLLAATRAVHLASVLLLFGALVLVIFVARPACRGVAGSASLRVEIERRTRSLAAGSLAVSVATGLLWLAIEAPIMSGLPTWEALRGGTVAVVLTQTSFGRTWMLRGGLALALGAALLAGAREERGSRSTSVAALLAAAYLAALAFAGHAAGGQGAERYPRIAADMVHLLAAGAWLGALPGLALLLHHARRSADAAPIGVAGHATRGFSTLGTVSVSALLLSGIANAWYQVRSVDALFGTEYGRLLLAKLALFAAMLALAAVNRWWLSPRVRAAEVTALSSLARNAMLETALGIAVVAIVGVLGITVPAMHPQHHHELHSATSRAIIASSFARDQAP